MIVKVDILGMPAEKILREEGMVYESLPGLTFKVRFKDNREILAHLAGRLRINHIKVIPGDRVVVEMSSITDGRGRIVRRL